MITYSIRLKKTKKKHVSRDVRKSVIGRAQSYNFPLCILSKIKHKIQNHKKILKNQFIQTIKRQSSTFFSFAKFEALETITWFPNNGLSLMT